jgi:hypothetical protein
MFQQKSLIIIFLALFTASAFFLFWQNARELDPDRAGSWWTLSFTSIDQSDSLAFIVDNHSDQTRFNYRVVSGKQVLSEASFIVEKGKSITITPDASASPDTRTSIVVTTGNVKKEIYK